MKNHNTTPENQNNSPETSKTSKTKLGLAALAMSTIISGTQAQANDLLGQCDYNHNGIIDGRTYLKDLKKKLKSDGDYSSEDKKTYKLALKNAKKERHCKTEIIKQENAQQERYLAQLDTSIEGLKKELKRVEEEIKQLNEKSQQLSEKSQQLSEKSQQLSEKSQQLSEKSQQLSEKDKKIMEEDKKIMEELKRQKQRLIQKIEEMAGRA